LHSDCSHFKVTARTGLTLTLSDLDLGNSALPSAGQTIGLSKEVLKNRFWKGNTPQFGDGNGGAINGVVNSLGACINTHYSEIQVKRDSVAATLSSLVGGDSTKTVIVITAGVAKVGIKPNTLDSLDLKDGGIGSSDLSLASIFRVNNGVVNKRNTTVKNLYITSDTTARNETLASPFGAHNGSELNTGFGDGVFTALTTGFANTAMGSSAMISNTTGRSNTSIGNQSMYFNTTGTYNVALGNDALASNTTGSGNIALGEHVAGSFITQSTGSRNFFGGQNVAFGNYTTASDNNIIGFYAGENLSTGSFNTFMGTYAGRATTTQNGSTFIGYEAGLSTTAIEAYNTFIGHRSGRLNTSGYSNLGLGAYSLYANTTGSINIAIGYQAMVSNTTGSQNYASGDNVMFSNTTGNFNTAVGKSALYFNTTGSSNTAIGLYALEKNVTGTTNTAVGGSAGINALGSGNVFIGNRAGEAQTIGNNKLHIANNHIKSLISGEFDLDGLVQVNGNFTANLVQGAKTDSFVVKTPSGNFKRMLLSDYGIATGSNNITTGLRVNNLSSANITTAYPSAVPSGTLVQNTTTNTLQVANNTGNLSTILTENYPYSVLSGTAATDNLLATDYIKYYQSGSITTTVNFPSASTNNGKIYVLSSKKTTIALTATGGLITDIAGTSVTDILSGVSANFISNGTNWIMYSKGTN